MRRHWMTCMLGIAVCCAGSAQLQIRKITEPAGKTLDKALKASSLTQEGAKPFHLKLQIVATKGDPALYAGSIEETWFGPSQSSRTLIGPGVKETAVVNGSGTHYTTDGEYMPKWLRNFETALFSPVPDASQWNLSKTPLEHIELPNGATRIRASMRSSCSVYRPSCRSTSRMFASGKMACSTLSARPATRWSSTTMFPSAS